MMIKFTRVVVFIALTAGMFVSHVVAQMPADSNALTPPDSLPLFPQTLRVDARFASAFPVAHTLNVPAGFTVNVFAANVRGARFMSWSPDSVLYVCAMQAGQVMALPDHDHDGIADSQIVVASNMFNSHSLTFYRDTLYVSEVTDVLKMVGTTGSRVINRRVPFVTGLADGGHSTRTILFDPPNKKFYVHVGSTCNICIDSPQRACVLQFNDDGTGRKVFASGLRNSVGLAFHPVTNKLWADNNGFDNAGNDIPPEVVNILEDGGFYGWPLAYGNKQFNPRYTAETGKAFTAADSARVASMVAPVAQVTAHSAPLGLHFYTGSELPAEYFNSAIMAFHGSWNRKPASGCKVVRLRSDPDGSNMRVADFVVGWQTDSVAPTRWGRPSGVISDHRGNIYIADDQAGAVYRVHYNAPAGVSESGAMPSDMRLTGVFPDPASTSCIAEITAPRAGTVDLDIIDVRGDCVASIHGIVVQGGGNTITLPTSTLATGMYRLHLRGTRHSMPLRIVR